MSHRVTARIAGLAVFIHFIRRQTGPSARDENMAELSPKHAEFLLPVADSDETAKSATSVGTCSSCKNSTIEISSHIIPTFHPPAGRGKHATFPPQIVRGINNAYEHHSVG